MTEIEKPDRTAAYRRAATIRAGVQGFAEAKAAIAEAYEAHDWITLGYTSWGEYCKKEIGNRLKMPRGDRDLAIQAFSELGMSVREIAESLDVAKSTVQDALKPPAPRLSGSGHDDHNADVSDETKKAQVSDPLSNFPDAEKALEEFHNTQTSGLADDPRADESGDDHPAPPLGDAADVAGARDLGDETGKEEPPVASLPVDGPERTEAGVSPSAPESGKTFDEVLDEHAPDPDPHRRWRAAFLKGVRQSYVLAEFADEDIVANGNDLCFEELINLRDFFDEKLRRVQELRLQNLPDNVREFRRPA
jgi:hypothetical protein